MVYDTIDDSYNMSDGCSLNIKLSSEVVLLNFRVILYYNNPI